MVATKTQKCNYHGLYPQNCVLWRMRNEAHTQEIQLSINLFVRGEKKKKERKKLLKQEIEERTPSKREGLCTLKWLQNRGHTEVVGKVVTCLPLMYKMTDSFLANSFTCNQSGLMGPSLCWSHLLLFPVWTSSRPCISFLPGMLQGTVGRNGISS